MIKDLKVEQHDEASIFSTPLEEYYYNSPNMLEYLKDEHFHNSLKGCEVQMIVNRSVEGDLSVNRICHTHNVTCSKTGWELGWYMGKDSRYTNSVKYCLNCGREVMSKALNFKYCKECKVIMSNKRAKELIEIRKRNVLNYYK